MLTLKQWEPYELTFLSSREYSWKDFPMHCTFYHRESKNYLILDAYWDGIKTWKVRFAPTKPGLWKYSTSSGDQDLDKKEGYILCVSPSEKDIKDNPNYHGKVKIVPGKRYFEYDNRTPVLLLAEQFWDFNISEWMNIKDVDTYLDNRNEKGFSIVQISMFRTFCDGVVGDGQNEGGYPFPKNNKGKPGNGNFDEINPSYMAYLDQRFQKVFNKGFIMAAHPAWIGSNTKISLYDCKMLERYCMARYGAFNLIWSLSGEFDVNINLKRDDESYIKGIWNNGGLFDPVTDCDPWRELGMYVASYNPYNVPISIHPAVGVGDRRSSGDWLHDEKWMDHNWIQTYNDVYMVPERVHRDYFRVPVKPVFFAEGIREGDQTEEIKVGVYGVRWEAWQALLSGARVYTYRHYGIYMEKFINKTKSVINNLDAPGSSQVGIAAIFLRNLEWWKLEPALDKIRVDGSIPRYPQKNNQQEMDQMVNMAAETGRVYVVYIPMNSLGKKITVTTLQNKTYIARWFNPITGTFSDINDGRSVNEDMDSDWTIPTPPDNNDWVVLLQVK